MLENRRHIRIREITDIRWTVLGDDISGEGKVLNISTSGLLFQTDKKFDISRIKRLYIDSQSSEPLSFGPKKVKIVWVRPMPNGKAGYICGVEFIKEAFDKKLEDWINQKLESLGRISDPNILKNYL